MSTFAEKYRKKAEHQRSVFDRQLREAIESTIGDMNRAIVDYNSGLAKNVKLIEHELNAIREKRNEQVKKINADYRTFEKAYSEAMRQIEKHDKESAKMAESIFEEIEQAGTSRSSHYACRKDAGGKQRRGAKVVQEDPQEERQRALPELLNGVAALLQKRTVSQHVRYYNKGAKA